MMLDGEDVTDQHPPAGDVPVRLHRLRHSGGAGLPAGDAAGAGPAVTASSWTAGTSARWCCRMRTVKIFLTAAPEVRARRRLPGAGAARAPPQPYDQVLREIAAAGLGTIPTGTTAPLRQAEDAVVAGHQRHWTFEESLRRCCWTIIERGGL